MRTKLTLKKAIIRSTERRTNIGKLSCLFLRVMCRRSIQATTHSTRYQGWSRCVHPASHHQQ